MSTLSLNTIVPRTTPNVDIQGVSVPTYLGSPLAVESSVASRFAALNGSTITSPDTGSYYGTSTKVSEQLQAIGSGISSAFPAGVLTAMGSPTTVAALIKAMYRVSNPIGKVISGYWTTAPAGTVELNGQTLVRTAFPELWAYVLANSALVVTDASWSTGTNKSFFSTGDSVSTFRVPDLRGMFLRAHDNASIRDPDTRAVGSTQTDALQNITGNITISDHGPTGLTNGAFQRNGVTGADIVFSDNGTSNQGFTFDASRVARTSTETRPTNVALKFCMYY